MSLRALWMALWGIGRQHGGEGGAAFLLDAFGGSRRGWRGVERGHACDEGPVRELGAILFEPSTARAVADAGARDGGGGCARGIGCDDLPRGMALGGAVRCPKRVCHAGVPLSLVGPLNAICFNEIGRAARQQRIPKGRERRRRPPQCHRWRKRLRGADRRKQRVGRLHS